MAEILDDVVSGRLTVAEARAIASEKVYSLIKSIEPSKESVKKAKKSKKSRKSTKKAS